MPIILEIQYEDQSKDIVRIPAEIWRYNHDEVKKVLFSKSQIRSITLDPFLETADCDLNNNHWPPRVVPTRFELFKQRFRQQSNPMQERKKSEEQKEN
jgi:hypothetical protein